jgi:predicted nucleic acid-binding protein
MAEVGLKQAVELSAKWNLYACDAYILACAINQRAPLLALDSGLRARARELKLDVLEARSR